MLSVIVPTMWRSPYVLDLLTQLNAIDCVGEIILIDNDTSRSTDVSNLKKVIHVLNPTNNYVSPSWNQGYELSKYPNLCFLNDDIIIPENVFSLVDSFIGPKIGIVGLLSDVYENILSDVSQLGRAEGIRLTLCTNRNFGYGCCMFMHSDNYRVIPDGLKIQYGDDFLFYSCEKNNFVLDGFTIVGKISATIYDDNLKLNEPEVCANDHTFFWNMVARDILSREPINDLDSMKLETLTKYEQISNSNYY
jgi:hypothetical protein